MKAKRRVLQLLNGGSGYTDAQAAMILEMPAASFRRVVYELRKAGWNIFVVSGYYWLGVEEFQRAKVALA